jgi:hypothetical protein
MQEVHAQTRKNKQTQAGKEREREEEEEEEEEEKKKTNREKTVARPTKLTGAWQHLRPRSVCK